MLRRRIVLSTLIALMATLLLAPVARTQYTESVLHALTGGSDGGQPFAGLIFDSKGSLYGTTYVGGVGFSNCSGGSCGVVFELTPAGGGLWTETVLYRLTGDTDGESFRR